jgi:hypothetical protein
MSGNSVSRPRATFTTKMGVCVIVRDVVVPDAAVPAGAPAPKAEGLIPRFLKYLATKGIQVLPGTPQSSDDTSFSGIFALEDAGSVEIWLFEEAGVEHV